MYSSYMYHLKVSVWIFYRLMNFHWDQKKLKYIWHYVHSWLQRSGIFVPLPRWLWGFCIYPCPGWLVGYLYKYVCECLPSPFPGRPHLISSIVQGSSKPVSSTNLVYQHMLAYKRLYQCWGPVKSTEHCIEVDPSPLSTPLQNPRPTVFCPRLPQPDPS